MTKTKLLQKNEKFGRLTILELHHKKQHIDKKQIDNYIEKINIIADKMIEE